MLTLFFLFGNHNSAPISQIWTKALGPFEIAQDPKWQSVSGKNEHEQLDKHENRFEHLTTVRI